MQTDAEDFALTPEEERDVVNFDPWGDRAAWTGVAFGSVSPLERLSLGMDLSASRWRDAGDSARVLAKLTGAIQCTVLESAGPDSTIRAGKATLTMELVIAEATVVMLPVTPQVTAFSV